MACRLFKSPQVLLGLTAILLAVVVQSGELGSSDTQHRLQATHSFWTSQPAVFPTEYPEFGIHGRGNRLYGWYGLGQSLLLLPSDVAGTLLEHAPLFDTYRGQDPTVRNIVVTYSTNTLICLLSAVLCFQFLQRLRFRVNEAMAGALCLVFATTFLHYTQNMMENNLIFLLTLAGFSFQYEWATTENTRALLIGSSSLAANLVVRLTTGLDLFAVSAFVLLVSIRQTGQRLIWLRTRTYLRIAMPCYLAGMLIDRLYQYQRFGSIRGTYISRVWIEWRKINPSLSPDFPWITPLREGIVGPLLSPQKSIFLFDPLLILTVLLSIFLWRRFAIEIGAYLVATFSLVTAYILLYARYYDWSGNFAWGDRFVSTAVQLAVLISVPLLIRHRAELNKIVWRSGMTLVIVAILVQLASVAFWCPLEIYQMKTLGPRFVIGLRFENIVAHMMGKTQAWHLSNDFMSEDAWDYMHITTFNFLPFLLRRIGQSPKWVVDIATALWVTAVATTLSLLIFIQLHIRSEFESAFKHKIEPHLVLADD